MPPDSPRNRVDDVTPAPSNTRGLQRLGEPEPLSRYARDMWARREFAWEVPLGELRGQHMNTVLGNLWHLLNPLLLLAVYYLVFGVLLQVTRGVENFLGFLAIGVFLFHWTQRSVIAGAKSIVRNEGLIRSLRFPRALLPLATTIEQTLAFIPALGVMIAFALATGERVTWPWLLIPVVLAMQAAFNLGAAFIVARLTDMFRDVENILPFVLRMLFYLSGVLYSVSDRFGDTPLVALFVVNPVYCLITLMRGLVMGLDMGFEIWLSASLWTIVLLTLGFVFFRRGEQGYGRG
jgi:teichoic acid transport system permease protein